MTDTDVDPNTELAYEALDLAMRHGAAFEMNAWAESLDGGIVALGDLTAQCGTTACLAGWVVAIKGYALDGAANLFTADGNKVEGKRADQLAAELLNIDSDTADDLFNSGNRSVAGKVAEIFGPRPVTDAHRDDACRAIAAELDRHPDGL